MTNNNNIETLFKLNYARMYTFAFRMLKDNELARDAVNDVFAEILIARIVGDIGTGYLLRALYNRCVNMIRNMSLKERVAKCLKMEYDFTEDNAEDKMEERIRRVQSIIRDDLPPKCSRVMLLRYDDRLSYKEIAQRLGISEVAVYKHLKYGIDYLRKRLNN